ncbi:hypothetical protein [Sansalvadorimonas verongulae]|uniref:hypothetical protein n=1 Tax=Sansalvadorimonas verongulae TaxID=2172824 RepID=UPI0012BC5828|nr:hypothetical protein [Sansalvadorimonas verongulae]MTI11726.1 hypothetical protein [Sansalvadorimonas verongulae]
MKTIMRKALAAAVIAGVSGGAMAASDGQLGQIDGQVDPIGSSQGSFEVTLFNEAKARIFGMEDLTIPNDNTGPVDKSICIYTNTERFTVIADSRNNFQMNTVSGVAGVDYTLALMQTSTDGTPGATWGAGNSGNGIRSSTIVAQNNPNWDDPANATCTDGNFGLQITPTVINGAQPGVYTDSITLTVAPY